MIMKTEQHTKPSSELVRSALQALAPEGYDHWLRVGMALHAWDAVEGLVLWTEWSRRGSTYREGEPARKWASFGADGGVSIGTVIGMAKANGWSWSGRLPRPGRVGGSAQPRRRRGWTRGVSVEEMLSGTVARPAGAARPVAFSDLAN